MTRRSEVRRNDARPRWAPATSVRVLRGVGPVAHRRLAEAGISTLGELLLFFPRRHDEVAALDAPDHAHCGLLVRLRGRVERTRRAWLPGRRSLVTVTFAAAATGDGASFDALFFNQPYLKNTFVAGVERELEGTLDRRARRFVLKSPRVVGPAARTDGPCVVRYREIEGVSSERLRGWICQALDSTDPDALFEDALPPALGAELSAPAEALRAMHRPVSVAEHEAARRQFALLEAVGLFRRVERLRRLRAARDGPRIAHGTEATALREVCIPFAWTADQARATRQLRERLCGPAPMGVLLQGDVGTGKTAVALDCALATVAAGYQVAFLAPTELLAEQHFGVIAGWLERGGIEVTLLTGSLPAAARRRVEAAVQSGRASIVVGTHALFSSGTRFARLGLVVVDEQHRFGVEQRTALYRKGASPHVLVMTATPIPRTLTMTLFGDLDVEVLRERPPGSRPARAVALDRDRWPRVLRSIRRCVRRGERAYVVCPRVGADGEPGGAIRMHEELRSEFPTGLVHGRMPATERQTVLAAFKDGAIGVLCGTTVLEVGVDVPEATLMVVVRAERFGLATLHQLRGRVGRGERRGLCILVGDDNERVRAVCSTTDGFDLAERDLRLRGAGEILGQRQSGAFDFRALDPLTDLAILRRARDAVRAEPAPSTLDDAATP